MKRSTIYSVLLTGSVLLFFTYAFLNGSRYEKFNSSTGCCSVLIDHSARTLTYYTNDFNEPWYTPYADKDELEEIFNSVKEYCYDNHTDINQ